MSGLLFDNSDWGPGSLLPPTRGEFCPSSLLLPGLHRHVLILGSQIITSATQASTA